LIVTALNRYSGKDVGTWHNAHSLEIKTILVINRPLTLFLIYEYNFQGNQG
jgi:hypothetical protein